ncbi:MAG: exosortase [Colwellia sp.]|nr:exosortase [Colwellia sp.]
MNINSFFNKFKINTPFLGILILFTAICALNIPILITLWRHGFDDGTYSHAFIIPFISLYLYYELSQNGKLRFRDRLSTPSAVFLVLSCLTLFMTSNAQISIGYWGALLAVFITSVTMFYRFNWYIVFPAAFLIFIFPFWGSLTYYLQNISVASVSFMMDFTNIPTYVEAEFVQIPAGTFEIADGCSGLRYLIVSLAISSLFIFLNIKSPKRALLFFSVAVFGGLLTNWLRIMILIIIGDYTDMTHSLMNDHNSFGWYIYLPFMLSLFYFGNKISDYNLLGSIPQDSYTPNKKNLNLNIAILYLITISFSSTTIFWMISEEYSPSLTEQNIAPKIYNFSNLVVTKRSNITTLHYSFNSTDLDSKPTYYENSLTPKNWQVISFVDGPEQYQSVITNGQQKAVIKAYYKLDNYTTGNRKKFKTQRIKESFWGKQDIELIWSVEMCKSNCE